ncbi:PucR family transcriptional regulator ligand-binding domain-containing protein [Streptomyces sp. 110]|uniref:PucR family transcriptional regulator ligand-binding domain-containing protein n=1 Tax=Streptomyces endocoffeicus TaxID=2898945 RepID=A0ABS1Q7R6_9ACTN|nr:PucR family transcriptional regulator [Streptomyces endocoffeicus]MBL1120706.1 PucR family transcriptional regulator ligand-binding domain-containing protein [Streptomyces endocoffeicus]
MAITIADLLEMPHLRLHLHSGTDGLDREVSWTHTSDLPEPWRWLAGGELLMTNGMSFPADGAGQRALIERLVDVGASGLAIGVRMYCPPLTDELAKASEQLGFSVLTIQFPLPFVAISRAVAVANLLEQSDRLIRTERIYHAMRQTLTSHRESSALSHALSPQLGCEVHVCHRGSAQPWYPQDPRLDPTLTAALRRSTSDSSDLRAGAFAVPLEDGREMRLMDIPTQSNAILVLVSDGRNVLDAILMQHAVTVIALELSQSLISIEHRRRLGAEVLAQLMEGRLDERGGRRHLKGLGLNVAKATLVAITSDAIAELREFHLTLWRNGIPHLVVHRSGVLYVLCVDGDTVHALIRSSLDGEALVGISGPIRTVERVPEALREASWAARAATSVTPRTVRYGDATPLLGVAGIDDAAVLVTRVLGALMEYERVHETELLRTLEAFLDNQRSWQKTADALHVHRQTVLYRIRKVEAITGHNVNNTRDIAELWLAVQARALLGP